MIGGRFANPVVAPPQVAIIGAGRISAGVIAHRGQPAVRRLLPLSLTFDHRVQAIRTAQRVCTSTVSGCRSLETY
jgi:pyruvate/2-oxoglutarate dehydrogenase complex dihydrolipoamide acyltransferase (E2) component